MVVAVKALACELPSRLGVPLSRFHVPDLVAEAVERGIVADISGTTIWRWLSEDLRPWARHLTEVEQRLLDFERRYETAAQPFEWSSPAATWPNSWNASPNTRPSPRPPDHPATDT